MLEYQVITVDGNIMTTLKTFTDYAEAENYREKILEMGKYCIIVIEKQNGKKVAI